MPTYLADDIIGLRYLYIIHALTKLSYQLSDVGRDIWHKKNYIMSRNTLGLDCDQSN